MMKGRIGVALVLLAAAGCGLFLWWTRPVGELSHLLGVDLARGTLVEETDTHGAAGPVFGQFYGSPL